MRSRRIHVMGASGAGVTTLGRALADALALPHHDSDDYFWLPTTPPYRQQRDIAERLRLMEDVFLPRADWVLSGSLASWSDPIMLDGGYTPGPLLALCMLAGLAGSLVLLRRRLPARTRQFGLAGLLFLGTAVFALLAPDVYQFSWRYELPAVITPTCTGSVSTWVWKPFASMRTSYSPGISAPEA